MLVHSSTLATNNTKIVSIVRKMIVRKEGNIKAVATATCKEESIHSKLVSQRHRFSGRMRARIAQNYLSSEIITLDTLAASFLLDS